mgnify:FL=1
MEVPMMLAGGAAIGIIAGCWRYIRHFVAKIFSLFVVTVKIDGQMPNAIVSYCSQKLRRLPVERHLVLILNMLNQIEEQKE